MKTLTLTLLVGALSLGAGTLVQADDKPSKRSLRERGDHAAEKPTAEGRKREHAEHRERERDGDREHAERRGHADKERREKAEHAQFERLEHALREKHAELLKLKRAGKHKEAEKLLAVIEEAREDVARRRHGRDRDGDREHAERRGHAEREHRERAEGARLERQVRALHEKHAEMLKLKRAGKLKEAEKLMHVIEEAKAEIARRHHGRVHDGEREHARRGDERGHELEQLAKRERHLREAAENLKLAGKVKEAQQIWNEADQIARHVAERRKDGARREHGEGPSNHQLAEAIEKLQHQIHELHEAVNALRQRARGGD